MQPYTNASELKNAASLQGPADFYQVLLTIKHGFSNGVSKLGSYSITKASAKRAGIPWDFVINSVTLLGLKIENRHGIHGHIISL